MANIARYFLNKSTVMSKKSKRMVFTEERETQVLYIMVDPAQFSTEEKAKEALELAVTRHQLTTDRAYNICNDRNNPYVAVVVYAEKI
ncbi:hypothetical protein [Paraflavitalea pollutisoli]|uniref:hypothetical protein n=1 Tax=Paraflavitalea pollutisoli TaxID=3034143 RepID=UPI0023EB0E1F|nr:hypothetical protein [Paraflavitalea sp. H1-2-19X]